jgi:hypothetical protein
VSALFVATAAGLAGLAALSGFAPAATGPAGAGTRRLGLDVLRAAVALFAALLAVELLIGPADVIAGQPFGVGLAALALAGSVALRLGIVPGHAHAARVAEGGPRWGVPILSVWGPALFALACLAAFESAVAPLDPPLGLERGAIAGLGVLTILVGGLAALVQDDVDHVVAYSILQDAALVMLAFASAGAAAWPFAATWLLAFAVAKTALLAWAAVLGRTFGGRSLRGLAGWARRAPVLAVALILIGLATIARLGLVRGALAGPLGTLVVVASLASIAVHGRLLAIGLGGPTSLVVDARDERLRRPKADLRRRLSMTARETLAVNRAPLSAGLVLALAVLAAAVGAGAFGLREAAAARVSPPLPGGEPAPGATPTFRPVPTEAPTPSS